MAKAKLKLFHWCLFIMFGFCVCHKDIDFNIIHFYASITVIVETDSSLLYDNLTTLERNSGIEIELAGHTNSIGSDSANLLLSQVRADTLKSWLIFKGIDSLRITAVGCGENKPVADNTTAEGRTQNDRVEFIER